MCGIAGIINLDGRPLIAGQHEPILRAMGDAMHHRGPDETRLMLWQNTGFIFKRLSIVDIAGGHQPFETPDGRVVAMVNGEIFNHEEIRRTLLAETPLQTRSDCEVIPYLYLKRRLGPFDPANGMFAAAILDRSERRVLLGRDRLGVKPLFYCVTQDGSTLVFASELKVLFQHPGVPRDFDWSSALNRDGFRTTSPRELPSGFAGIERVPAGSLVDVSLRDGSIRTLRYWQLPAHLPDDGCETEADWVDRYQALLEESVRMRLMADTQFGVFLSGGIDSAIITAIAAKQASFPTFSVLSQSTLGNGDAHASQLVARTFGLPNYQVAFDEARRPVTPDDWRRVLWSCELWNMTAEQLYKYYLHGFAKERYPDLNVILLGQGSDEMNGGYTDWTIQTLSRNRTESDRWAAVGECFSALEAEHNSNRRGYFRGYGDLIDRRIIDREFACRGALAESAHPVWDQYFGYYRENLDYHLWHEDRTAAAHSIENRVPFMDYRLVELVARTPLRLHRALFSDKAILRRAAASWLPPEIASRPKGPFFYGPHQHHTFRMVYQLLTQNSGELVEQAIAGSRLTNGPLDPARFREYVAEVGSDPRFEDIHRLMFLVNMGVLAEISATCRATSAEPPTLPVSEIALPPQESVSPAMPASRRSGDEPTDSTILTFGERIRVVEVRFGGNNVEAPGKWYFALGDQIESRIDSPGWLQFLSMIDGKRSVGAIIAAGRLNRARTWKLVRDAVRNNYLVVQGAYAGRNPAPRVPHPDRRKSVS
ncbi:MAG: asparagine synthase (glutamine-hydrolyzing) [Sterolibacteriaceae bacterium]|nr:asparagine synthase (glutamine-hydrolyzing) [Candidatus Methylophosphatis haderslevensis]